MKDCIGPKEPNKEGDSKKERPKSKAKPSTGNGPRTAAAKAGSISQSSALIRARAVLKKKPLLDTSASHVLLNLDLLDPNLADEAKRIHVHQGTVSPRRPLLLKGILYRVYAADVGRSFFFSRSIEGTAPTELRMDRA